MALFNIAEVVDMGIEKEKRRRDFYGLVAERFQDKEMKDLFMKLKGWEQTHIDKFSEIRESVLQAEATEKYPGELKAYMDAVINDKLYKDVSPDSFSQRVTSPLEAIEIGITFEKDAIVFFNGVLPYTVGGNKQVIQDIIDEERQHIIYLTQLKQKYGK